MKTNGRTRSAILRRTRSCRDGVGGAFCIKRCVSAVVRTELQALCPPCQGRRRVFCGRGCRQSLRPPVVPLRKGDKEEPHLSLAGLSELRPAKAQASLRTPNL